MRTLGVATFGLLLLASGAAAVAQGVKTPSGADIARGRYMVKIAGCNDCHTPDYAEKAGAVPENGWLTGSPVGFQGEWGTTYPANLRLVINAMTEAQWMARACQPMRPPMPWFALRDMTDGDVRAIYRYVKALGPAGQSAPAYVPPGGKPITPVIVFPASQQQPPPTR